jgi:hypothetical protein
MIILVMIVKNESENMISVLDSVRETIDAFAISDTGSTDDTKKIIQEWSQKHSIPGIIDEFEFQDFGTNRSHSFSVAKKYAIDHNWTLSNSFALLLDADSNLNVQNLMHVKECLENESHEFNNWHVAHELDSIVYKRGNFLRLDCEWTCVGAAHEYWTYKSTKSSNSLAKIVSITEKNTGGMKPTKSTREINLLEKDLEKNPENPRTLFYLGRCLIQTDCPISQKRGEDLLIKRLEYRDFPEECYEARIVLCREARKIGDTQKLLYHAFCGMKDAPTRPEIFFEAGKSLRWKDNSRIAACEVLLIGIKLTLPPRIADSSELFHLAWIACALQITNASTDYYSREYSSVLFMVKEIVHFGLFEEFAISSTWTDARPIFNARGKIANNFLLKYGNEHVKQRAFDRKKFFE